MSGLPWSSHSVILKEAVFEGYLVADSPLRIGVGNEAPLGSAAHLAVLRIKLNGKLVPYIPGSSLKGVFRSTAILLANQKGLTVCSGLSEQTCMDQEYHESCRVKKLLEKIQEEMENGNVSGAIGLFHERACLLCKVFGAPSFRGHAEFCDSYPVNENGDVQDVPVGVRAGIAINRRTGAVRQYYRVEYVEPGARFKFSIRTTNLPNYALGLLAKVVRMLNDGWVRIGGFKTRGFGEVRVETEGLRFTASGPTVQGTKMFAVDEEDVELDLAGHVSSTSRGLEASGDEAWEVLAKLEEVWDRVKFKPK